MPERIYNKITTEKRQVIIDMYLQEKPIKEICDTTLLPKTTITSIINVYKKESRIETKRKGGRIQLGPQNGIKVNVKRAVDSDRLFSYKQILLKATDIDFVKSSIHKIIDNFCYSINLTDTSSEKKNDAHTMEERFRYAFQYFRCVHEFGENNIFFLTEVRFSIATRSKKTNNDEIETDDEIKVRDFSFYSIVSRSGILHRGIANTFQDKANYIKFVYEFIDYLTMKRFYNCVLVLDSTIKNQLYDIEEYVTSNSHYVIYLPAYSPMLNPVLSSIDKVKCIVAAANAQNEADILKAVEFGFNSTTLTDIDDFYLRMIHFIRMSMAKQPIN